VNEMIVMTKKKYKKACILKANEFRKEEKFNEYYRYFKTYLREKNS
jgi:hypothetical protein